MKTEDKIIEEEGFPTLKENDICTRCEKNKATLIYTDSQMDFIHGFTEKICQECYDKQMKESNWYKQGIQSERARIKEEIKKLTFKCLEDYCYQGAPSKAEVQRVKLKAEGFDKCKLELLKVIDNSQQKNIDSEKVGVNPSGLVKLPSADKIVEKK